MTNRENQPVLWMKTSGWISRWSIFTWRRCKGQNVLSGSCLLPIPTVPFALPTNGFKILTARLPQMIFLYSIEDEFAVLSAISRDMLTPSQNSDKSKQHHTPLQKGTSSFFPMSSTRSRCFMFNNPKLWISLILRCYVSSVRQHVFPYTSVHY